MRTSIIVTTLGVAALAVAALIYVCGLGTADRDTSEAGKIRSYLMRHRKEMTRVTSKPYHVKGVPTLCFDIDSFPHRTPEEHWIHVFVSPSGTNAMATGKGTYPVGAVILKQKFWDAGGTNTEFYTGMRKREGGYNPKSGDWDFFTLDRGGQKVTMSGEFDSCMDCHAKYKETDFVSRRYLNTKEDAEW